MWNKTRNSAAWIALGLLLSSPLHAEVIIFEDCWGQAGYNLIAQSATGVEIVFSIPRMEILDVEIGGELMQSVIIPGVILPNQAGAPNLPGVSRYLALPQQARAELEIVEVRTQTFRDLNIVPAFEIPRRDDDGPLKYEKDPAIYGRDADYPAESVLLSQPLKMRGVDVVILGITPFAYNPMTRDLTVYRDIRVRVNFSGGNGHFGEDRLRNRWWEPVLRQNLSNYASLQELNSRPPHTVDEDNVEYLIIIPDDPDFAAWADTLKRWRNEQGIITGVTTLTEIGGNNATLIENYINNAYQNWEIPPVAVLLLSDYQGTGDYYGITSPMFSGQASDNTYADIDGDNLPDLNIARITAQNDRHLSNMIAKMLSYEREPYTDPGFYLHPMLAGAWQTSRWFILNTEIIYGFMQNELGKQPVREYTLYSGTPGSQWSSNVNTWMVVEYFGPQGLGYIPATPEYLTDWGGNAARINAAFNHGAFIGQHCDHGEVEGWSEPSYTIADLDGLQNEMYPYIFSDNCSTGEYTYGTPCFAEAIHRMTQGALGIVAASGTSYSFVADVLVWGFYDGMWPEFDPGYGTDPIGDVFLRPGFALTSAKYYLQASSWPYNPSYKNITIHQHHHHGDAFLTVYSEMPQLLTVCHDSTASCSDTTFTVSADSGALIGLSVDCEVVGAEEGTGSPVAIGITPIIAGQVMRVTVTKANYYRYIADIPVVSGVPPAIEISLLPENPPIQIPASGGAFNYTIALINNAPSVTSCDVWCMMTLPDSSLYGPVLGPVRVRLQGGETISRDRTQTVPERAPAGQYSYNGYVGTYPSGIWSQDSFDFTKLGVGRWGLGAGDWTNTGESFDQATAAQAMPNGFTLERPHPNPFNPTTVLSFELRAASLVKLNIYDLSGRRVAELINGWREAGLHEVTFDGSGLASGVYLVRLDAGDQQASQKMVMMK